jgi:ABC-type sugar transport system permease subunit
MDTLSKVVGSIFLLPVIFLGYYCFRHPDKMAKWRNKGYYEDDPEPTDFMIFLVKTVGIIMFIVSISILAAVFLGIILKQNNLVHFRE